MEETEQMSAIKNELDSENARLTKSDRRLLKTYFGFLGVEGVRKSTRKKEDACNFIRECLFENIDEGSDNEKDFDMDSEIIWDTYEKFPTVSNEKELKNFLTNDGITFEERTMVGILRSYQVRGFFFA